MTDAKLKKRLKMLKEMGVLEFHDHENGFIVNFPSPDRAIVIPQPWEPTTTPYFTTTKTSDTLTWDFTDSTADVYENPMTFPGGRVPTAFPKKDDTDDE